MSYEIRAMILDFKDERADACARATALRDCVAAAGLSFIIEVRDLKAAEVVQVTLGEGMRFTDGP